MLKKLSVSMILMLLLINNYSLAGVIVNCSINNSLEPSTAKSATIYNELAYVNFTPEFTRAVVAHEEAIITNESWSYTVTTNDSSVVCTPKSGIGKDATINVTCKKTGQYTITVTSTINYTIKRYINRRPLPAENKTESGVGVVTLIVKHPDEIKLVDARHVFNYAPMDMTGKWGKGNDEILIGVDNNNKIKLKFIDITGTSYEYSIAGDLTRAYTAIANDTPFEIESTGDAEKSYQVTLKDASGNEATWQVKGFPKAWRDSRISSLESNANWLWGAGCRFSYNLVNTFLKFTAPPNCTSITADQSVTDTRLTHNCGASFNATTKIASVQKFTFGSSSDVSKEISKFKGILGAWTKCIALATVTGYKSEYPKWLNSGGFVTTRAADYAALKAKFDATAVG
ncbi:MAG: hypothetical protein LBC74_05825, partial [Planctomycetaceae bacterium]|nr:hypothetical protein [Planctomycetaceae bacterium]